MVHEDIVQHGIFFYIHHRYLKEGAEYEINVDFRTRLEVYDKIQLSMFDNQLFDHLQEAVFYLIRTDCFSRFRLTEEYP